MCPHLFAFSSFQMSMAMRMEMLQRAWTAAEMQG